MPFVIEMDSTCRDFKVNAGILIIYDKHLFTKHKEVEI